MPRLSLELRKAAIHMRDEGRSTEDIRKTLEAQGHSIGKGGLYKLFKKFDQNQQVEDLKKSQDLQK